MESISPAGVMELRIHVSVSAMMSRLWLSIRSLSAVTCSGVSMERVLRVQMRRFAGWVGPSLRFITSNFTFEGRCISAELIFTVGNSTALNNQL